MSVNCGFSLAGIALAMLMRMILLRANKRLATAESEERALGEDNRGQAKSFRYVT